MHRRPRGPDTHAYARELLCGGETHGARTASRAISLTMGTFLYGYWSKCLFFGNISHCYSFQLRSVMDETYRVMAAGQGLPRIKPDSQIVMTVVGAVGETWHLRSPPRGCQGGACQVLHPANKGMPPFPMHAGVSVGHRPRARLPRPHKASRPLRLSYLRWWA
jgi:hypothetical protein